MNNQQLTPWFPMHVKPHRPGVYRLRRHDPERISYARWDGRIWRFTSDTVESAAKQVHKSWQCYTIHEPGSIIGWAGLVRRPR